MPLQATSGAASYDAFGGGIPPVPNFIEDVFSTTIYTGNGSTQTITNGIDLSGIGGLVWTKCRNDGVLTHRLNDTVRGITNRLFSNTTGAQSATATSITAVSSNGYTVGSENGFNQNTNTFVSWTFREQPKFFDIVTYSGSSSTQNIAHNLGSVPGCIIVKRTSGVEDWFVYHTSLGNTQYIKLNTTGAVASGFAAWNNTSPTSTQFTVLGGRTEVNAAGSNYVAYLFAHDAGGFGLSGADNVITCGSYTGNGNNNGPTITLGYEPQWLLIKQSSSSGNWWLTDSARGFTSSTNKFLLPNSSTDEITKTAPTYAKPESTGFKITSSDFDVNEGGGDYIYIAIRKGPMR